MITDSTILAQLWEYQLKKTHWLLFMTTCSDVTKWCIHSHVWQWLNNKTQCQHQWKIPCPNYLTQSLTFSSAIIRKRHESVWVSSKEINQQLISSYRCHVHAGRVMMAAACGQILVFAVIHRSYSLSQ